MAGERTQQAITAPERHNLKRLINKAYAGDRRALESVGLWLHFFTDDIDDEAEGNHRLRHVLAQIEESRQPKPER